jgi:hypothetical protein
MHPLVTGWSLHGWNTMHACNNKQTNTRSIDAMHSPARSSDRKQGRFGITLNGRK